MQSISHLKEALITALDDGESRYDEQELFDELMVQKPRLLKLLDFGERNQQEQREIESGKTVINGKPVAVNSDFARHAFFLSQQLNCSERYLAEFLHSVMSENPNVEPVTFIEETINRYHKTRRDLVDALRFLLEAAEAASLPNAPDSYKRIAKFAENELILSQGGEPALAQKIFQQIEKLDNVIAAADVARKNAGSNTVPPSGQGNPSLGYGILNARYESLRYERRYLATALCCISRLGHLSSNEIKAIVEWLSNHPSHPITYYFLVAILLAFDPADPDSKIGNLRQAVAIDNSMMVFMTKKLAPSTIWKEPGLKATVLLKWTMFLTEARHNNPALETRSGFKTEELETQVWNAVQGDSFLYLALTIGQLQWKQGSSPATSLLILPSNDQQENREYPPEEFKAEILLTFETLLRSLITHASSELRKIKQRQEDLVLASVRDRSRTASSRFASSLAADDNQGTPPRHDIAMLYTFIGLLYSALPEERALQFWGSNPQSGSYSLSYQEYVETTTGRLPSFLQWAVWSTPIQDLTMLAALYDMLNGLAKGQQCSELAYNFMARGGGEVLPGSMLTASSSAGPTVSWTVIFSLLESWASNATSPRAPPPAAQSTFGSTLHHFAPAANHPTSQQVTIGAKDVLLSQSFLRLLSTVVTYSITVRTTVAGHAHFRAIPTLLSLVPLGIPLELKGAIFDTLAAFCEPGAGAAGMEICKAVWTLMERLEVINVRSGSMLTAAKGVEIELEQIEAAHRLYPSTIPFLKLLCTLIHTSKRIPLKGIMMDSEPINTIPESLGQPYRLPGVGPFTSFVIDNVFVNIPSREYSRSSDRWQINDLCLCYVERALAGFELESLVTAPNDAPVTNDSLIPLLIHPGYDVMKRLLTASPLQASLMSYIVEGIGGFEKPELAEEPFFRNTITRVLRIVHRVLEIQDIFLEVLVPMLSDFDSAPIIGTVYSRSFFTRFDQALSFGPQYIPALAAYMIFPPREELVLLSVKIIALLSATISSSTLVNLVEQSIDSERITGGFMRILSSESTDDVQESEEYCKQMTGAGAPDANEHADSLMSQATRIAALDLLIQETEASRPFPNIAHFFLFGATTKELQIQDPHALGSRQTGIHILLNLVNSGVPRLKGRQGNHELDIPIRLVPLFTILPGLAERCYCVIYQLCVHPRSSEFTTRYLRTRENFFARQLANIPSHAPEIVQKPHIQVQYPDGSRITTTVSHLSSFIRLRSFIFDLVALELHNLTNKAHYKGVTELLQILFGNDFGYEQDLDFPNFHDAGQSNMRIIDFFQSLTFDWLDSMAVEPIDLEFLSKINLQSCVRNDPTGCEIVDQNTLVLLLAGAKHALYAQGHIVTSNHAEQLSKEAAYILESCAIENHRRKISHALVSGFESWRRMLDMALTKCFDRLPHDRRENMLFDLLHVIPPAIQSPNIEESTAILLSETVLSSITNLREDRRHQIILQSVGGDPDSGSLPAERLFAILRSILDGILESNHAELVRGNLYAALTNFVHLITSSESGLISMNAQGTSVDSSLSSSFLRGNMSLNDNFQVGPPLVKTTPVASGFLTTMKSVLERLIIIVSRDATDGTEVWKSIAFMLLDALVQLSAQEKQHAVISALLRHGILSNFVQGIKESDLRFQSVLKPDPDDLNPLYVYESKMSLFIRMSHTRYGAERLLESKLLPILAQCDYLDARPEADQSFMDQDSFLPSAVQRYHQMLMPALQVLDGILAVLGSKHVTAANQALDFLSSHSSTIVILLKSEPDYISLALLEELQLIVALCSNVLPNVPKSELLSANSGFGAIHASILGLSTRCLGHGQCFSHVVPQTDADIHDNNTYALGWGSKTRFDINVRRRNSLLRRNIVSYIGTASEFTEPEITLVLSPITNMPRPDQGPHFSAAVPTLGDAFAAMDDICMKLVDALKHINDLSAEIANRDHISVDNIHEMLQDIHKTLLQDFDVDQKRSLICQELGRIRRDTIQEAKVLITTLEMILLVVTRHLEYYTEPRNMNMPPTKTSLSNALRLLATTEPESFKDDVGAKLSPVLQRLSSLNLDYEILGQDWQTSNGYIEIMCRRLRDISGLHDENSM